MGVDPWGLWTLQLGLSGSGGAGAGATYGRGFVIGYSGENGFQFGKYSTVGAGAYSGVGGGVSVDLSWSSNSDIESLGGIGVAIGGSVEVPVLGVDVGGGIELSNGSSPSYSIGVGLGKSLIPFEKHSFITKTKVY
jgi:hypothetical protein